MIQLRVRTEFSFRQSFAPLGRVVERLKAVGATAAGMVDLAGSTWGHVRWEAELRKAGIAPLFGAELGIADDPEAPGGAPAAWALGQTPASLYKLVSKAVLVGGRPIVSRSAFLGAEGIVRFAGAALARDAEAARDAGVILDLNPGNALLTRDALATARRIGNAARIVLTGDNLYVSPEDRKLHELTGRTSKTTPQHIMTERELCAWALSHALMTQEQVTAALHTADEVAQRLRDVKLRKAPLIKLNGDVEALCREGIQRRVAAGQIAEWTDEYEQRLRRELELVREKEFDSYFLVVADMTRWAKQRMLVGPARGSAAGSLMCYLMDITEVDPLPFGLLFERFVDITRTDLPDIDLDFPDEKRDSVYAYLADKYGAEHVARIGTISEYKPKSALGEVAKRLSIPPWETQAVKDAMFTRSSGDSRANNCLIDTLNETAPGRELLAKFPAIALAGEIEGHASHTGVHAAGVIVCNEPITDFCSVIDGVAQLDKLDAEKLGLLKIDVLGLRTLGVIEDAGVIGQEELYRLPLNDPAVFNIINSGKFSSIFQWEGQALQSLTRQIEVTHFDDMTHITALARPGPLGGGAASRFIARHRGDEAIDVAHPSMHPYLDETFGLVLYQEQVIRIARDIGKLSWEDTTALRKAMSKSYGKEFFDKYAEKFVKGAAELGLKQREAMAIWDQINSMGSWSFNKSHAVAYALVSYWTAWLKAHHPLEYAAAALRNAKDEESAINLLREVTSEGVKYTPFDPERSVLNWSVVDGELLGGFLGLKGIGPSTAEKMLAERAANGGKLSQKSLDKLAKCATIYGDLYPAHSRWAQYYNDPEAAGLKRGSKVINIADMPSEGEVVFIGQLRSKDSRDQNETVRLARRGGRLMTGPTLFLDMRVSDDSTLTPFLCRIDRYEYEPTGRLILERGREDVDWFLIRGRKIANFPMVQIDKIKCLNDPDLLKDRKEQKA